MLWHLSSLEQMTGLVSWGEALESVKEQSVVAVTYLMENTLVLVRFELHQSPLLVMTGKLRPVTLLIVVQTG